MLKYLKIFIITALLLNFISCANKDQESLLLDAEGGNIDQNDALTEEIEIIDNTAQIIASDQFDPDSDPATDATVDDLADGIADDDEGTVAVTIQSADIGILKDVAPTNASVGENVIFTHRWE